MDDQRLLREFVHTGSQSAFRILVERHIGLVYSAAQRMRQDAQLAEVVTQGVFATLARKADSIAPSEVLARWLYDTTRRLATYASLNTNQRRGGGPATNTASTPGAEAGAGGVGSDLEAMMDKLTPADRDAIVLRFLENRTLPDVAEMLHLSETAAHARVNHAVEQLHTAFNDKGVPIASAVLATVLSTECAVHVPIGLAIAVSSEALEAATTVPAQASSTRWWNPGTAASIVVAVMLALAGVIILQYTRGSQLKSENERLRAERKKLKADFALGRSAPTQDGRLELVRLRRTEEELLRLRREVAQLRREGAGATPSAALPEPPPPDIAPADPHESGAFISSADLKFMGYTTPEAAMESALWSAVVGNYDTFLTALNPADRAEELNRPESRELFEARQRQLAPLFKGMQAIALKVLSEDEVELKVLLDFGTQLFQIQPLVRINEQWRLANSMYDYDPEWDNDGEIQQLTAAR